MKIIFSPKAEKQFKNFGKAIKIIITKRVRELGTGIISKEEKLKGYKSMYRLRVADYRIVYKKTSLEIYVVLIGHRKEVYRLLQELMR